MDKLTKKERMELNEMLRSIENAGRRLAAGKIKPSELDSLLRAVREREALMRMRRHNSLSDPMMEQLSQVEHNRVYAAGYESGFTEGLRKRLADDMTPRETQAH